MSTKDSMGSQSMLKISLTPSQGSPQPRRRRRSPQTPLGHGRVLAKRCKYETEVTLHVLLPNSTSFQFPADAALIDCVQGLLDLVRWNADEQDFKPAESGRPPRQVVWGANVKLENNLGTELTNQSLVRMMKAAKASSTVIFIVQDGHKDSSHGDTNMWNVTPKPEMLGQLPQGYTLETALADQLDNALQAVWLNDEGCNRLISVDLSQDQITIFDTGRGMDASDENSISNWGTVGGSTHREAHQKGLGGKPPFLKPYLGKYGAGGVAAALHLGGCATVWSKTKESKKAVSLVLEQKDLVQRHREDAGQRVWRTAGSFRDMTKLEREMSPHGSFTKVTITKLKQQYCLAENEQHYWTVENVRRLLKEIYFPYLQVDAQGEEGSSSGTRFPVDIMVNGKHLVEVEKCETAILNRRTCNGEAFVVDVSLKKEVVGQEGKGMKQPIVIQGANAQIRCQYFPNIKGEEALEAVVEQLNELNPSRQMTFENMNRVNIRWLGRLLPEVKWEVFPFMAPPVKKEHRSVRVCARRVRAFVDTDAGFHPVQSKTELERDQPFVVALQNLGSESFEKTSALGVKVIIKRNKKTLTPSQLAESYLTWLRKMHSTFDEEFVFPFLETAKYIFKHGNCLKDLGLGNSQCVVVHTHMKDSKHEWIIVDTNPIYYKLPRGPGLKADKYVTLEYFFHDAAEDEGVQVYFLCRGIEVDAPDGCQITTCVNKNMEKHYIFQLKRSEWFPASVLIEAKRLDAAAWKIQKEKLLDKLPDSVKVLNEEETTKFESWKAFPVDKSRFEAGFCLPADFFAVIRPRKFVSATTIKQETIFSEPLGIKLQVKHCTCANVMVCRKLGASPESSGEIPPSHPDESHIRVVSTLKARSTTKNAVKGLYIFSTESSNAHRLVEQGIYTFTFELESEKYKDVLPAVYSIEIVPSAITAQWTFCNHPARCMISDHDHPTDDQKTLVVRLNDLIEEDLFLQKYDQFGNSQSFETSMDLEIFGVTLEGEALAMQTTVQSSIVAYQDRYRILLKNIRFTAGSLEKLGYKQEALLRVRLPEAQHPEIKCRVLPGALAAVEVISSQPPILPESLRFEDPLLPGDVIRNLALQGLDACSNKIEKGQIMRVILEGVEFQDDCGHDRVVDENGQLQLGGLLKVTSGYNSTGSITFVSDYGSMFCKINFTTVERQLVADKVPLVAYIGGQLQGITIKMVDAFGVVDVSVDAIHQSITVDWLHGVTYPLMNGECILPSVQMPGKPGTWEGHISFSLDPSLCTTVTVEVKLGPASSFGPAREERTILTAECGVAFILPFEVYDDNHMPALLDETVGKHIDAKCERKETGSDNEQVFRPIPAECKDVRMSMVDGFPVYEAHIVLSGSVGVYTVTLIDTSCTLDGKAESQCKLQHGPIEKLRLARSDGTAFQKNEKSDTGSLPVVEVKKRGIFPALNLSLLDSHDNVCNSCNGRTLRVRVLERPQWKEPVLDINHGVGRLTSFCSDVEVGRYQILVELDRSAEKLYFLEDSEQIKPVSIQAQFYLRVHHGNYPSSLKLLNPDTVSISLTEETVQYLPPMSVLVEAADGLRLQSRPAVGVKIFREGFLSSAPKEYLGELVESCDKDSQTCLNGDHGHSSNPARYTFTKVCTPSSAGSYQMDFIVSGGEIPSQSRYLVVCHGPPKKTLIMNREPGKEINTLKIRIVDAHGNLCEGVSGLQLRLNLNLCQKLTVAARRNPCVISSNCTTLVEHGNADFGVFQLTQGIQGLYSLKVSTVQSEGTQSTQALIPAEAQVLVMKGDITESLQRMRNQNGERKEMEDCAESIVSCTKEIELKKTELLALQKKKKSVESDLITTNQKRHELTLKQNECNDPQVVQAQMMQPLRDHESVIRDLTNWAETRNNAALFFWRAFSEGQTFSQRERGDFLGLVVTLAQVEDEALNRVLSDFLGTNTLLLIITRTQRAVNALETYDAHGTPDENGGLHGYARSRGHSISGQFDVLSLGDIRPYERVMTNHSQRILNIDPPRLPSGEIPRGFLDYAVNLVYLRPEHLRLKVDTKVQKNVGLRESLFYRLFRSLQVYDTRQNMISAKDNIRKNFGGAVSLDGGYIGLNCRQRLGISRSNVPICFGLVPFHERRSTGGLKPPECYSFKRMIELSTVERHVSSKQTELSLLGPALEETSFRLKKLHNGLKDLEKRLQDAQHKNKNYQDQILELQRAANAVAAGIRGEEMPCSQGNLDNMRAFMM